MVSLPASGGSTGVPGPNTFTNKSRASYIVADALLSSFVAIVILGVYLATIYPGLLDIGDASKFAFVGRVLGTPHAPGYPLYVMVSHLFGYLPIGSLAYRMNLLSAILGAVTSGLSYLIARQLGVRPMIAASTSLALGLGQSFWATSLYAKTYTLNSTLVSAGVLMLLRWHDTRRVKHFYAAMAIFALSVGNHLTVIALVPALILFAVVTDRRTALSPKTIALGSLFVLLGLAQYSFILIRTLQGAPYLEAKAATLGELWGVMTARRFAHEIGAYGWPAMMSLRVPQIGGLIGNELGAIGVALVALGLVALLRYRPRHALLLGGGALGVATLTVNMSSGEDRGFLLSVFAMLWPIAAAGLEWTVVRLKLDTRRAGLALAACLAALIPSVQVAANYRANDHHAETFENDYFDALFAALPNKAAIVDDEYHINMFVLYKLLGERAAGARDIRLVPIDADEINKLRSDGYQVLVFREGRRDLAQYGFRFDPYDLHASGRAAIAARSRDVFLVTSSPVCLELGNVGWMDMTRSLHALGRLVVKVDNYRPHDSTLTVYAGGPSPFQPSVLAVSGAGTPMIDTVQFASRDADAARRLAMMAAADHVTLPETVTQAPFVVRTSVHVNDDGRFSTFSLDLGGQVTSAIGSATVDLDNAKRALACSHALEAADIYPTGQRKVRIRPDSNDVQFDPGWYAAERRADGLVSRWTSSRAVMLLPLRRPRTTVLSLDAAPLQYPNRPAGSVVLRVNGRPLPRLPLPERRAPLVWTVPQETLRDGLNEFIFEVNGAERPANVGLSSDSRLLGLSVTSIGLAESSTSAP